MAGAGAGAVAGAGETAMGSVLGTQFLRSEADLFRVLKEVPNYLQISVCILRWIHIPNSSVEKSQIVTSLTQVLKSCL